MSEQQRLRIVPLTLAAANAEVARLHRHHQPAVMHRWSIGVQTPDRRLVGVAIAMRPASTILDDGRTIEVARVATDGTPNACSCLYGAMRRIAREMGFERIISYVLSSEPGTSLRAAGWTATHTTRPRPWNHPSRPREDKHPMEPKVRWECWLVPEADRIVPARPVFGAGVAV